MTDYLALLNTLDENERLEAKRATEIGPSILETICAFANEPGLGGGTLLLGVVRDDADLFSHYAVEGIAEPDRISAALATQCREKFNTPVRVDIAAEEISGKTVLVVTVPEAEPANKPIFIKSKGLPMGAYRRIGSTDQRCTEDDLVALYQDRQKQTYDATVLSDTTVADLSPDAIADYRKERAQANPDAEELRWSDDDLLLGLSCAKRVDGFLTPTAAGLLLFGSQPALRRVFPMMRVDYIRVPGKEWVPDPDRRFDSVEIRDFLFRAIRRALATVLDDLPKAFGLKEGEAQRTDRPLIPQRALREGIVNALMHRSYRVHAPVQVIRYSNRIEIRNPGYSLKSPEHLGEPGSVPRNPYIASVLLDTRFAETKGSGIRVMRDMMSRAGLEPPLFESSRSTDTFVARYYFQHFLNKEAIEWLGQFRELHLSNEDARALVAVREQGAIDNSMYRELNQVDTIRASQALRRLRDAGLLEQRGRGSATHYLPSERLRGTLQAHTPRAAGADPDAPPEQALPAGSATAALSSKPAALSSESAPLSSKLGPLSSKPDRLSSNPLWQQLPADLQERIAGLGQRAAPDRVKEAIVQVCGLRAWPISELAALFDRSPVYLGTQYLRPLVAAGKLRYTHPDQPSHPQQAYRAADGGEVSL